MNHTLTLVYLVIHHRFQQTRLCEVILHLEVALLVQFIGGYPNESNLLVRTIATTLQLFSQVCQHLRSHHSFASSCWSLEYQSLPVA